VITNRTDLAPRPKLLRLPEVALSGGGFRVSPPVPMDKNGFKVVNY
jgi:hypothetical protein